MERKVYTIILSILFLLSAKIFGNDKTEIYNAYIRNDMVAWKKTIDRIQNQESKSNELLLSLVNYQYGYIGWCIGNEKEKEAENYISLARNNLAVLERNNYNLSMVFAYYAALYGYEIGLSIIRAPFIGPKSMQYAENALKLDQGNPFAYLQLGNIQYYMPSLFGGSVNEAIRYFLQAKVLMENDKGAILNDWNYLHLLTLIVQAYTDIEDFRSAKAYCEIILKIEPKFLWIKDELYPQVLHQFKN
jgi:hypothetical protein